MNKLLLNTSSLFGIQSCANRMCWVAPMCTTPTPTCAVPSPTHSVPWETDLSGQHQNKQKCKLALGLPLGFHQQEAPAGNERKTMGGGLLLWLRPYKVMVYWLHLSTKFHRFLLHSSPCPHNCPLPLQVRLRTGPRVAPRCLPIPRWHPSTLLSLHE